ncbi:NifB/NifX family molybdenum-iron cluster-binding protein [Candidatus Bathyarchaeota archaeon]|nr:NifB/NifX family molybdenum-iron cluster-binding protein [Candidatus Bathyarchaeota archaeon]
MRVVYALSEDKESISPLFARAKYFKIVEDGRVVDVIPNPYVEAVPAGPEAVKLIAKYNPDRVVAGNFGPIASEELRKRGIEFTSKTGRVDPEVGGEFDIRDLLPAEFPAPPIPRFIWRKLTEKK